MEISWGVFGVQQPSNPSAGINILCNTFLSPVDLDPETDHVQRCMSSRHSFVGREPEQNKDSCYIPLIYLLISSIYQRRLKAH